MLQLIKDIQKIKSSRGSLRAKAEKMSELRLPSYIAFLSKYSSHFIVLSIWCGSIYLTSVFARAMYSYMQVFNLEQYVYVLAPLVFMFSFVLIAGIFAQISRFGIIEGKFPRLTSHPIYALRKIYGTAWTQVFYFKPLYAVMLAIPLFKRILFRLFGYRSNLDFALYPDSWIRDLPLVSIGKGAYIANRCALGTNLSLSDGSTLVGPITIGEGALIGHLCAMAVGCKVGDGAEMESTSSMGVKVKLGKKVKVCARAGIYHAVDIGENSVIGAGTSIGVRVRIGPNIRIAMGAYIPTGAHIKTQEEANDYFSLENQKLKLHKENILDLLKDKLYENNAIQADKA